MTCPLLSRLKSAGKDGKHLYMAVLTGLEVIYVHAKCVGNHEYEARLPSDVIPGRIYLLLTNAKSIADEHTVAGPAIITYVYLAFCADLSISD